MPKVKVARKSTYIDNTAMCDVAFLLLTFFMLTSKFTQVEPVMVSTPKSHSETKIPDVEIITVLINKDGRVFFGIDGQEKRLNLLDKMAESYPALKDISPAERKSFSLTNSFGVSIADLKWYLSLKSEERSLDKNNPGIPVDSTNNQFKDWMKAARSSHDIAFKSRLAIKADKETPYKVIKNVMNTLQEMDENRYNLITSLEAGK